jgi:hypothetical protein
MSEIVTKIYCFEDCFSSSEEYKSSSLLLKDLYEKKNISKIVHINIENEKAFLNTSIPLFLPRVINESIDSWDKTLFYIRSERKIYNYSICYDPLIKKSQKLYSSTIFLTNPADLFNVLLNNAFSPTNESEVFSDFDDDISKKARKYRHDLNRDGECSKKLIDEVYAFLIQYNKIKENYSKYEITLEEYRNALKTLISR